MVCLYRARQVHQTIVGQNECKVLGQTHITNVLHDQCRHRKHVLTHPQLWLVIDPSQIHLGIIVNAVAGVAARTDAGEERTRIGYTCRYLYIFFVTKPQTTPIAYASDKDLTHRIERECVSVTGGDLNHIHQTRNPSRGQDHSSMIWPYVLLDKVIGHGLSGRVQTMPTALHNASAVDVAIGTQGKCEVTPTRHLHNRFVGQSGNLPWLGNSRKGLRVCTESTLSITVIPSRIDTLPFNDRHGKRKASGDVGDVGVGKVVHSGDLRKYRDTLLGKLTWMTRQVTPKLTSAIHPKRITATTTTH